MECLIVSRATFSEVPKSVPPRAILPPPGHSPVKKVRNTQRHFPTQARHSLSLDTLTILKNSNSPTHINQSNYIPGISEFDQSIWKKHKKKKRVSSHSISPQHVDRETVTRHSPNKTVKILSNQIRDYNKPLNQSDTVLCPDRIMKRAISNLVSRSATLPYPDRKEKLSPYSTTSMLKLSPSPPKHLHAPSRPIRTSPQRIRTSAIIPNTGFSRHKLERPKTPTLSLTHYKRRIFLSDTHNPGVAGDTSGRIPPLNSPIEVSHSVEMVPSLGDVRSQVSLQKELRTLELKRQASARTEIERERANYEKRAGEERLRDKAEFRAQIYALNSVMRAFEQQKFFEAQSAKV